MSFKILDFYKISSPLAGGETDSEDSSRFKRIRWATFLSATTGYGIYYVCRLSMNVVRKPIVEEGVFSETQLGIIGSCLDNRCSKFIYQISISFIRVFQ